MRSLPLFHRIAGKKVVVLGEGAQADAKRRLVERAGGVVVGEDDTDARLAFVTLAEPEEIAARLKARGLLVNVTDRPELCDFTMPSILERDPVLIAVGTSGASAGLAKQLRLRLEALLPPGLGKLADALHAAREQVRARWPGFDERRRALDTALADGGALDPLREHDEAAVAGWLESGGEAAPPGHVPIELASDDPDDLTLRQARLLGTADAVLHDPDVPAEILVRARADALRRMLPFDGPLPEGLVVELRRRR
jgi:uroporphyrin-III C-methyltransferase / precorrin-2 dehydrogenase / sirohydrochlorin ferrochelatase